MKKYIIWLCFPRKELSYIKERLKLDKNVASHHVKELDVLLKIRMDVLHGNFESLNLGRMTWGKMFY